MALSTATVDCNEIKRGEAWLHHVDPDEADLQPHSFRMNTYLDPGRSLFCRLGIARDRQPLIIKLASRYRLRYERRSKFG